MAAKKLLMILAHTPGMSTWRFPLLLLWSSLLCALRHLSPPFLPFTLPFLLTYECFLASEQREQELYFVLTLASQTGKGYFGRNSVQGGMVPRVLSEVRVLWMVVSPIHTPSLGSEQMTKMSLLFISLG